MRVVGVFQLLVQRQVETDRALADVGAPTGDIGVVLDDRFEAVYRLARLVDRGVLRQVQVDEDFRTVRRREELVLHKLHGKHRGHEQRHGDTNRPPTVAHGPQHAAIEGPANAPWLGVVRFHIGAEDMHADHRRKQHRHHPRHQHRHGNHREQGKGVLARRTGVEANRHEAGHGHQRAGEHREGRGGIGVCRRLFLGFAFFQARDHHLHGDHRVIHQQAEGDDQCAQRHALHGDAAVFHEHEHQRQHQRNRARHHQPGAHAEADKAHHQHDDHRLEQRAGKPADGFFHHFGLVGHLVHADAHRQVGGQLVHAPVQGLAERLDIAALLHGDGQANRRFAVEAEHWPRRVHIATADVGNIRQPVETVIEAQVDVGQVFLRGELPGGAHRNPLRPSLDHPGRRYRILRLQALHDLALINPQCREFARGEIQVDHFVLLADHFDLAQPRYRTDFGAHLLHVITQLTHRQAIAGKGIHRAEHVTEFIVERRPLQTLGEGAADVVDLLANLVPDLRDGLGAGGVLEEHEHRGLARPGVAFHVVEGVEFLEFFLDAVGDLLEGFFLGRARPAGLDHHGLDGERRVFFTAQVHVREHAHQQRDEHQVPDEGLMLEGPVG